MNSRFVRFTCRILIASMLVLPFQARAGLVGTEQAIGAAAQARTAREAIAAYVGRTDVAQQLQALGLSPQEAQARVAALSDAEITALAGRIDSLPAGGSAWIPLFLIAILLIWRFLLSDQAQAEAAAKKTTPAPEKK
jgi:hypothetical protein